MQKPRFFDQLKLRDNGEPVDRTAQLSKRGQRRMAELRIKQQRAHMHAEISQSTDSSTATNETEMNPEERGRMFYNQGIQDKTGAAFNPPSDFGVERICYIRGFTEKDFPVHLFK